MSEASPKDATPAPDIGELGLIGAQIAELGVKLRSLREDRDELNVAIGKLEAELLPLITKHAQIVAAITGTVFQPPQPHPAALSVVPQPYQGSVPGPQVSVPLSPAAGAVTPKLVSQSKAELESMKKRIKGYLSRAEPREGGISALQIADELRLDPDLVRLVMREWMLTATPDPEPEAG
jgi:hypothetical protein